MPVGGRLTEQQIDYYAGLAGGSIYGQLSPTPQERAIATLCRRVMSLEGQISEYQQQAKARPRRNCPNCGVSQREPVAP